MNNNQTTFYLLYGYKSNKYVGKPIEKGGESEKALRRHVDKVMNEYNRQYEDGEITWEEYVRRCPYGYEAWSCPCGKWTGNFKYNKRKYS